MIGFIVMGVLVELMALSWGIWTAAVGSSLVGVMWLVMMIKHLIIHKLFGRSISVCFHMKKNKTCVGTRSFSSILFIAS